LPFLPGLTKGPKSGNPEILQRLSIATNNDDNFPDETFFDMLMKCQASRIEEQRSSLPNEEDQENLDLNAQGGVRNGGGAANGPLQAPTVPDEDFFSLIQSPPSKFSMGSNSPS